MATTPNFKIPYPASTDAPDGPGALYNIANWLDGHAAPTDMVCDWLWASSSDPTVIANNWTDIPNDTKVSDPYNMRQSDGVSFKIPVAGRWSLFVRVAFAGDDLSSRYMLCWQNVTTASDMSWRGISPIYGSTPAEHYTEEILPANTVVKPRVYRNSSGTQWMTHFDGHALRLRSIIRYLGPA